MSTVKITMTDGTTREVHPDAHTTVGEFEGTATADAAAEYGYTVNTVFEPVREDWTPYEPWMRDVLADDARVSWVGADGSERRDRAGKINSALARSGVTFDDTYGPEPLDTRVHPDDVPERPAEVHPNDALAEIIAGAFHEGGPYDAARAAREHIDNEPADITEEACDCGSRPEEIGGAAHRIGCPEPAPADVDPLAEAIRVGVGKPSASDEEMWANTARAAREHIYAEWNRVDVDVDGAQQDAMQAREDVERLTREHGEWKARHAALRADVRAVVCDFDDHPTMAVHPKHVVRRIERAVLDRDDERGRRDITDEMPEVHDPDTGERVTWWEVDPDTVTLRRYDANTLLTYWHREPDKTDTTRGVTARVRAALGWDA